RFLAVALQGGRLRVCRFLVTGSDTNRRGGGKPSKPGSSATRHSCCAVRGEDRGDGETATGRTRVLRKREVGPSGKGEKPVRQRPIPKELCVRPTSNTEGSSHPLREASASSSRRRD